MANEVEPGNDVVPSDALADQERASVPAALFQQFLDNQTEELKLRASELEMEKQKDSNGFQFAQESLRVQADDRKHLRETFSDRQRNLYWLLFAMGLMAVALIAYALRLDKDEIAKEIIKAIVFVATGFIGGFGLAKSRQAPPPPLSRDRNGKK